MVDSIEDVVESAPAAVADNQNAAAAEVAQLGAPVPAPSPARRRADRRCRSFLV
jgi:hypothetical protein